MNLIPSAYQKYAPVNSYAESLALPDFATCGGTAQNKYFCRILRSQQQLNAEISYKHIVMMHRDNKNGYRSVMILR